MSNLETGAPDKLSGLLEVVIPFQIFPGSLPVDVEDPPKGVVVPQVRTEVDHHAARGKAPAQVLRHSLLVGFSYGHGCSSAS